MDLQSKDARNVAALMEIRESVSDYAADATGFMWRCLNEHKPSSVMGRSAVATAGTLPRAEHRTVVLGYQHLFSARDHFQAFAQLLRGETSVLVTPPTNVPQFACFTLLRGCLEPSARAAWLLQDDLDPITRASRGMAEQAYSLNEAAKLRAPNVDTTARLLALEREAGRLGIAPCAPQGKNPKFGQERRPDSTPLTGEQLQAVGAQSDADGFLFRLLSAYSHSTNYALILGITQLQSARDITAAQVEPPIEWIVVSAVEVARVHQRAMTWLGRLAGIDGAPVAPPLP